MPNDDKYRVGPEDRKTDNPNPLPENERVPLAPCYADVYSEEYGADHEVGVDHDDTFRPAAVIAPRAISNPSCAALASREVENIDTVAAGSSITTESRVAQNVR